MKTKFDKEKIQKVLDIVDGNLKSIRSRFTKVMGLGDGRFQAEGAKQDWEEYNHYLGQKRTLDIELAIAELQLAVSDLQKKCK